MFDVHYQLATGTVKYADKHSCVEIIIHNTTTSLDLNSAVYYQIMFQKKKRKERELGLKREGEIERK